MKLGDTMAFDTFDEGIVPGGMRSKYEIRILICYLLNSIKEPVSKEIIVDSICEESLQITLKQVHALTILLKKEI